MFQLPIEINCFYLKYFLSFLKIIEQLRKHMSQSPELFIVWSDQKCLLLHESWDESCTKKESFSDGSFITLKT